ncbi:MAG: VCBS repeat-containing protein [Saprospiraceae bacterium]|nr:VCBS repeat-containing protein [Saprospiraceae bacterium]
MRWIIFSTLLLLLSTTLSSQAAFTDQSSAAGVNNVGFNRGVAVVDFNNDGWEDLYFTRIAKSNLLYRNNGDGTFSDVSQAAGVAVTLDSGASVWGDLDNDGWADLVLGNRDVPSQVFRNNGDGTFTDITQVTGVNNIGKVQTVLLADVNNDGWLDIYWANLGTENALYLNQGNGTFTDVTLSSGTSDTKLNMGAVFFDYDNDGDQDLYLSHDGDQANILYQNDGKGQFTDVSTEAGVNYEGQGMGVDAADFNNDGYLDLYITNLYENTLYLNNQDGTFSDLSTSAQVDDLGMGWGTIWMDYDNDGWMDLYVANETYFPVFGNFYDNIMYRNLGDLTFESSVSNSPLNSSLGGYGTACIDVNKDGNLDIIIANSGATDGNQLLMNQGENGHHWINLELEGTLSNRDAVGASLCLYSGELRLCDQLMAGTGYASQNSMRLHFGLGENTTIDSLIVKWPSGQKEVYTELWVDSYYHIIEATSVTNTVEEEGLSAIRVKIFPNPVQETLTFEPYLQQTAGSSTYKIWDSLGRLILRDEFPSQLSTQQIQLTIPSTWLNGLYFLQIEQGAASLWQKFLLNR